MARMQNKVVVVTGAAQGIGAAIAQRFAEESATLVLLDLDSKRLQRTAAETGKAPTTIVADVTDEAAVDKAFARVAAEHGSGGRAGQQCRWRAQCRSSGT